jgi:hypothetical protein
MNKKIIAVLSAIIVLLGGGAYMGDQLGWGGGTNPYVKSISSSTTTAPIAKQSIYYPAPTSTDPVVVGTHPWIAATSTIGKPYRLFTGASRTGFKCCDSNFTSATTTYWLRNGLTTLTTEYLTTSTDATTGFQTGYKNQCFSTHDLGINWGGEVYILGEGTTELHCWQFIE